MSIRCRIFGHKLALCYENTAPWLRYPGSMLVDNLGLRNLVLESCCSRCGDSFVVGYLQLPRDWVIEPGKEEGKRVAELLEANNAEVERRRRAETLLRNSRGAVAVLAEDLIEIAGLAMPDTYFATDSRVQRAKLYLEVPKHDG